MKKNNLQNKVKNYSIIFFFFKIHQQNKQEKPLLKSCPNSELLKTL